MSSHISDVCAVVVTFNPDPGFSENVSALAAQAGHVVIIDNGSNPRCTQMIEQVTGYENCTVTLNGENKGLAAALNMGVEFASTHRFPFIIFFDQDSSISPGFLKSLRDSWAPTSDTDRIAIVFPKHIERNTGREIPPMMDSRGEVLVAMTSGSMSRTSLFEEIGLFRDDLFMDYIDIELCLRIRKHGLTLHQVPEAVLLHSLGSTSTRRFLNRRVVITNHSAKRRYYITRNRLALYAAATTQDLPWLWRDALGFAKEFSKILLFEEHRLQKLANMGRGALDALRGKMGQRVRL